jgi:hypothetical protein
MGLHGCSTHSNAGLAGLPQAPLKHINDSPAAAVGKKKPGDEP